MISSYYRQNQKTYISDFATYLKSEATSEYGGEFTSDEIKTLFKDFMLDSKNIKVDLRQRFWKHTLYFSLKEAGYVFFGLPRDF